MKRILRPLALFAQSLPHSDSVGGQALRHVERDRNGPGFFLITVTQQKEEAEGMKVSPMREVEQKKKSIPPLSQSRYGDMACEALYVHKDVQGARLGESEPAARGIEIHRVLAAYIDHLVRTNRATDLEVFDSLIGTVGAEAR